MENEIYQPHTYHLWFVVINAAIISNTLSLALNNKRAALNKQEIKEHHYITNNVSSSRCYKL